MIMYIYIYIYTYTHYTYIYIYIHTSEGGGCSGPPRPLRELRLRHAAGKPLHT